jgi:RimJ/RimL family protein N-acetyltransferase
VELVHLAVSEVAGDARKLYESLGFQEWGREPRALYWDGRYADESHMVLDLRDER